MLTYQQCDWRVWMEADVELLLFSPLCNILFSDIAVISILLSGEAWRALENGCG